MKVHYCSACSSFFFCCCCSLAAVYACQVLQCAIPFLSRFSWLAHYLLCSVDRYICRKDSSFFFFVFYITLLSSSLFFFFWCINFVYLFYYLKVSIFFVFQSLKRKCKLWQKKKEKEKELYTHNTYFLFFFYLFLLMFVNSPHTPFFFSSFGWSTIVRKKAKKKKEKQKNRIRQKKEKKKKIKVESKEKTMRHGCPCLVFFMDRRCRCLCCLSAWRAVVLSLLVGRESPLFFALAFFFF